MKAKRKLKYWRVTIVYVDKETSGNRVFTDLGKAKRWAAAREIEGREEVSDRAVRAGPIPLARST